MRHLLVLLVVVVEQVQSVELELLQKVAMVG